MKKGLLCGAFIIACIIFALTGCRQNAASDTEPEEIKDIATDEIATTALVRNIDEEDKDRGYRNCDTPTEALQEFFRRQRDNEDYMALCSSKLLKEDIDRIVELCRSIDSVLFGDGDENFYQELTGKPLARNETILNMYGVAVSEDGVVTSLGQSAYGYAVLVYNEYNYRYFISDIDFFLE
ncbi:MAG: hypothetical protein FWD23_16960 [Oscillospiraceae bacterium]|nr:hypothetical protein [Oscillospiraceae bacterium]